MDKAVVAGLVNPYSKLQLMYWACIIGWIRFFDAVTSKRVWTEPAYFQRCSRRPCDYGGFEPVIQLTRSEDKSAQLARLCGRIQLVGIWEMTVLFTAMYCSYINAIAIIAKRHIGGR